MLLTRSPLIHPKKGFTVRLACVKHAASVRPEPGSNSPSKNISTPTPQKRSISTSCQHRIQPLTQTKTGPSSINKGIQPEPPKSSPDKRQHPKRVLHKKIGIDLKHAVEFSSFGHPTQSQATRPTLARSSRLSSRGELRLSCCVPRFAVSSSGGEREHYTPSDKDANRGFHHVVQPHAKGLVAEPLRPRSALPLGTNRRESRLSRIYRRLKRF